MTKLLDLAKPALERGEKVREELEIINTNRTVGTILSNEIAKKYGHDLLPDDTIHFKLNGPAGQSFGAFLAKGVTLELEGDSNDYVPARGSPAGKLLSTRRRMPLLKRRSKSSSATSAFTVPPAVKRSSAAVLPSDSACATPVLMP